MSINHYVASWLFVLLTHICVGVFPFKTIHTIKFFIFATTYMWSRNQVVIKRFKILMEIEWGNYFLFFFLVVVGFAAVKKV